MICKLLNSVSASRKLSLKHIFCLSQCSVQIWRVMREIVWAVDELNKCKNFSLHFLKQIFHDWCNYYRIFQQFHFSVGTTLKPRNSEKSCCPELLVLEDFQKGCRCRCLRKFADNDFAWEYQHRADDGWTFISDGKAPCSQGFLQIIRGLFLF